MCGRYYFQLDEFADTNFMVDIKRQSQSLLFKEGEIYPKDQVLAIVKEGDIHAKAMQWGLDSHHKILINARNETIHEKASFRQMQKCIIPCLGFYEWDLQKHKYYIRKADIHDCYLAGLYAQDKLVILTGEAEFMLKRIHDRTPLIMDEKVSLQYLNSSQKACVDNRNLVIEECSEWKQMSLF